MYDIIFFGSFGSYSSLVLKKLLSQKISLVITTPPRKAGRHQVVKKTPVHLLSLSRSIPVRTPERPETPPSAIPRPDFVIVAGYGQKLPPAWLDFPKIMALPLHVSLLPRYAGRCPAQWAILNGEKETGFTIIKMDTRFDRGDILVREKIPILPDDTQEDLYRKLYTRGARVLVESLPDIATGKLKPKPQKGTGIYAPQITRKHGKINYSLFQNGLAHPSGPEAGLIRKMIRALHPWPGVWTITPGGKRLKIISFGAKPVVQMEGKNPTPVNEIKNQL